MLPSFVIGLREGLERYRTTANPSGYRLCPQLTATDKRGLAAAVKAVQEPLSKARARSPRREVTGAR